jgi:hypothetical protein
LQMCGKVLRSKTTHMQMHSRPANAVSDLEQLVKFYFEPQFVQRHGLKIACTMNLKGI